MYNPLAMNGAKSKSGSCRAELRGDLALVSADQPLQLPYATPPAFSIAL